MRPHRKLPFLFSAFMSLFVLGEVLSHAQNDTQNPIYPATLAPFNAAYSSTIHPPTQVVNGTVPSSVPWMPPPAQGTEPWNLNGTQTVNYHYLSTYEPARIASARHTANQYRTTASSTSSVITKLANTNANLADQWADQAEAVNIVSARIVDINTRFDPARREYDDVVSKLRQSGLSTSMGMLLVHKKSQIESWRIDGSTGLLANEVLQRLRQVQWEKETVAYDGSDVAQQASALLRSSGYDSTHAEYASVSLQVQALLRERAQWLQLLTQGANDYRQRLSDLDSVTTAFEKLTDDFRKLIHRHVIWMQGNEPIGREDFRKLHAGFGSLSDSRRTTDFVYALKQKWHTDSASRMKLMATILILLLIRFFAKAWLIGIGGRKKMRDSSVSTRKCVASLLTPLVAIIFPCVLYLIARWLASGYVTESIVNVASGIYAASFVALFVEVPRQLLRRYGFVEKHLKIDLPQQQRASVYLFVIGMGLVLAAFVVSLAEHIDHGAWSGSVARIGFIAALLLVAWTAHLALKPRGGFLEPIIEKFGGTVLYRIRYLFYVLGIGFPLAIIALSALGYKFAATEIAQRAGIMFVATLIGATLWAAVKITASGAWHALTGTRDENLDDRDEPRVSGALAEHSLEVKHQIAFLCQCALVLAVFVGVGYLWVDVFPNVRMGNPVLWTVQDTVAQSFIDASGQKVSRNGMETTPVTALHLILAGATLFVAFQLAKLLPAIFDALVLQHVSFDEAMEHLSLVVGRCFLFGTGCFLACRMIGVRWEAIQWLAVGLFVGLGFGLQDIVKSLLGGLIVLFEKPARLGDLITVGSVTGRVAEQKLRTTVLSDEDGREVIIPNKNFVSQDVVNWMGAGRLKAIPMEFTVTRDERPADVCRMLQQLLVDQPELLLNPAPQATLVCVSQKWQRIELRAWVEEDQDVSRCRDTLLKTVLNFLGEKNLLAPNQPRQPSLKDSSDPDAIGGVRSRSKRSA